MFTKAEWKNNLLGCLEVFLFMPKGLERFSGEARDAFRSLIIPAVLLPLVLVTMVAMSPGFSPSLLISLHALRIVAALVLFLTVVYFFMRQYEREEHFFKFLNVSNWCNIPGVILVMPILVALMTGAEMSAMESYAVFITLVGYVYSAFVLTHCFRLPWELGGFIAIVGLAIDDNLLHLTVYVRDLIAA